MEKTCETCKHKNKPWYSEVCDGCTRADSRYEQDLISRQDAVNAVLGITMYQGRVPVDTVMYRISKIPSAEPKTGEWVEDGSIEKCNQCAEALDMAIEALSEPLTDKEQRIFLAAMGREEKVCKQVDDECRYCREPYEDSLVRTCHEITRKVKGALWTI